jgi:hypothetical protein
MKAESEKDEKGAGEGRGNETMRRRVGKAGKEGGRE